MDTNNSYYIQRLNYYKIGTSSNEKKLETTLDKINKAGAFERAILIQHLSELYWNGSKEDQFDISGMYLYKKRLSCVMELPHSTFFAFSVKGLIKSSVTFSASAVEYCECLQRSTRPLAVWCLVFHSSIDSKTFSFWWMAMTGPSARMLRDRKSVV